MLGVPCVTVRESTERPVTVTEGTNILAPWPLAEGTLLETVRRAIAERSPSGAVRVPTGWDGHASERIVDALLTFAGSGPVVAGSSNPVAVGSQAGMVDENP